jgi:hypothetical protein
MRMHICYSQIGRRERERERERTDGSFVVIVGIGNLTIAAASSFSSFSPL